MKERNSHHTTTQLTRALLAAALLAFGSSANAVLLTTFANDLVVSGATIDLTVETAEGTFSQLGHLRTTEGGSLGTTPFMTSNVSPADAVTLTDTGDGLGASMDLVGDSEDDEYVFKLAIELDFSNNSATDTIEITLQIDYQGAVDADDDAYAYLALSVMHDGPQYYSNIESDAFSGDLFNDVPIAGSAGAALSDGTPAGGTTFVVSLAPGEDSIVSALWVLDGGAGPTLANGSLDLTILDVAQFAPPPDTINVPEPNTLLLLSLAIAGLAVTRRRHSS